MAKLLTKYEIFPEKSEIKNILVKNRNTDKVYAIQSPLLSWYVVFLCEQHAMYHIMLPSILEHHKLRLKFLKKKTYIIQSTDNLQFLYTSFGMVNGSLFIKNGDFTSLLSNNSE